MDLVWEDPPAHDGAFFTKELYDKYSLAPNVRELWLLLNSDVENTKQECDAGAASNEDDAEFKDNGCESKESFRDSCDNDPGNAFERADECEDTKKSKVKPGVPYPEPRLPFPCLSSLSSKDQITYLGFLTSKKSKDPPQNLSARVHNEVMQFRMYLQDVARICADDYNFISQGAMQYSEDFFKDCLEYIKTLPQSYQIHEMTSLTGGTFNPGLMLTFEKQLLIMGNVDITDHKIVPADAQLASDYQSVSSVSPPAKKAKDMHATISSDINAEKLSSRYEPHVCLTRDALVRLLDNHGPDFKENWELPVLVKLNQAKGSSQKKTVYIDSPLLKTEATTRDRSHIYHEESLKLSIKKNGSKDVFHLMTERPVDEKQLSEESSHRNLVSFENTGLDFEVDLTDLETFGEVAPSKTSKLHKMQNDKNAVVKSKKCEGSQTLKKSNRSSELLDKSSMNTSSTDIDDPTTEQTVLPLSNSRIQDCAQESNEHLASTGDSGAGDEDDDDDDKLVIDDVSPSATPTTQHTQNTAPSLITTGSDATPDLPSPQKGKRRTRQPKPTKVTGDQLGEILRMQTAMFSHSASDTPKCSTMCPETNPSSQNPAPTVHSHPTSLVKPCVTSYLERTQNQEGEASAGPLQSPPLVNVVSTEHKRILSQELQAGAEDEHDYDAPEGGNLLYKLYSLQDLLLMVRSSVSLTHTRNVGSNQNQYVPVKVLPKLEYQMSYGVECLTNSEACQLWTETLLHSSTVSYIGTAYSLLSLLLKYYSL